MMIGVATVMPTQIIADLRLVIHATSVIMYSQAMKVKNTSIAEFVKQEWAQVKIWANIAKRIQIIAKVAVQVEIMMTKVDNVGMKDVIL